MSKEIPYGKFFIKGKVRNRHRPQIKYGIESYFVKEGTGKEVERKLAEGAYAKVVIDKTGRAKVRGLIY